MKLMPDAKTFSYFLLFNGKVKTIPKKKKKKKGNHTRRNQDTRASSMNSFKGLREQGHTLQEVLKPLYGGYAYNKVLIVGLTLGKNTTCHCK